MENLKNVVDEKGKCVVCFEEKITLVLDPCRHACLCKSCYGLISKRNPATASCPICKVVFVKTEAAGDDVHKAEIPKETLEKYIMTREDFIKEFNLVVERKGSDLVMTCNLGHKIVDDKITLEVIAYYLGDWKYSNTIEHIFETFGPTMNFSKYVAYCKANGLDCMSESSKTIYNAFKSVGIWKYVNFFNYVGSNVVPPEKLCKHLIDSYFQKFLTRK